VDDAKANPLKHTQVHGGVGILKNQMACAFSGFARRLNIQSLNDPHIGLDRMEQGNIIHATLQYATPIVNRRVSNFIIKNNLITP
jgi:hypothetical protein